MHQTFNQRTHGLSALLVAVLLTPLCAIATDSEPTFGNALQHSPSPIDTPLPAGVDAETGFRMERYRRPVPSINPGIEVVNTARALALQQSGKVVLIDVYPPRGLGADPLDGNWLTNEQHQSLPGAVWIPEVGRGYIGQQHIDYFTRNLEALTGNQQNTPLLFFCTSDCWQSWNAARRARLWGYTHIFWYPSGTDGWSEEGHSLVPVEAVNFLGD